MREVMAMDMYAIPLWGGHQISISDYTAIVLEIYELSESNRFVNGEQSSGQLLRSGCIQRHVGDGE